ncbi:MAG: hypothetical protein ACTHOO_05150 [Alcanivorax sp.]
MTYQIGIFCIILAVVIGISALLFRIPIKRTLSAVAALLILSACMVLASMVDL